MRSGTWSHFNGQSHGLRDDQDVGEDDRGVQQTRVASDGLHGEFAREVWCPTDCEERVIFAHGQEFGQVAT